MALRPSEVQLPLEKMGVSVERAKELNFSSYRPGGDLWEEKK